LAAANIPSASILIFSTEDEPFVIPGILFDTVFLKMKAACFTGACYDKISINPEEILSSHKTHRQYPFLCEGVTSLCLPHGNGLEFFSIYIHNTPPKKIQGKFLLTFMNYYK
jgi:hypothetical protein